MLCGWMYSNKALKGPAKSFYRIPKVLKNQAEDIEKLIQKRYSASMLDSSLKCL